jgi:hypothetical protein
MTRFGGDVLPRFALANEANRACRARQRAG